MRHLFCLTSICALAVAIAVTLATALATLASLWWVGELLTHLRVQYTLVLLICLPSLVLRFRRAGWLVLTPLLINATMLIPLYSDTQSARVIATRPFTIVNYNLDASASDHTAAFNYLRNQRADILSLQELTPGLDQRLATELPMYRVIHSHPMTNSQGSALLLAAGTEIEVISASIVHFPQRSSRPLIAATLNIEGQEVALLSLHIIRPLNARKSSYQQVEFAAAAAWSREQQEQGRPVLIIGDFNATPCSSHFRQLLQDGHLLNSERGYGIQPTWPANLPSLFRIPLDHCLYSQDIIITDRRIGPFLGSDHASLHVQFALAGPKRPAAFMSDRFTTLPIYKGSFSCPDCAAPSP